MTRKSIPLLPVLTALAAAVFLPACESSKSGSAYSDGSGYDKVVDYTTPKTNLSKEEYPFDEDGNYLENYAARGAGVSGVKDKPLDRMDDTAMYTQPADDTPAARTETYTSTASYTPPKKPSASSSRSSGSSSSRSTTASRSKPKPRPKVVSKPKPKPKPKPPQSTVVKVQTGDTLYGLAKKHGTSVAAIKSANGLSSDTIRDGKSLKIPKKK